MIITYAKDTHVITVSAPNKQMTTASAKTNMIKLFGTAQTEIDVSGNNKRSLYCKGHKCPLRLHSTGTYT